MTYIYKIGTQFPKQLSKEQPYPLSELDKNDGFIHLSTAAQVPGTVGRFFKDSHIVELLKIKVDVVEHKLKWEASSSHGTFPHIYGDLLGGDVLDIKRFTTEDPSTWEAILQADSFLE